MSFSKNLITSNIISNASVNRIHSKLSKLLFEFDFNSCFRHQMMDLLYPTILSANGISLPWLMGLIGQKSSAVVKQIDQMS